MDNVEQYAFGPYDDIMWRRKSALNICKHCGTPIAIRNQTGTCDHLYWPEMLTDEAKIANGIGED